MMFVFFDNTDTATKISIGVVLAILVVMIVLVLCLERQNTIYREVSYIRLFTFLQERFNSLWDSRKQQKDKQRKTRREWICRREPDKKHSMADRENFTYAESITFLLISAHEKRRYRVVCPEPQSGHHGLGSLF